MIGNMYTMPMLSERRAVTQKADPFRSVWAEPKAAVDPPEASQSPHEVRNFELRHNITNTKYCSNMDGGIFPSSVYRMIPSANHDDAITAAAHLVVAYVFRIPSEVKAPSREIPTALIPVLD